MERVSALAGISNTDTAGNSMRPITVAPSRIASGGSVRPTLTSKVRVTGLACGATSRTRPLRDHLGIVAQRHGDDRIARRRADQLRRHVEHGVAAVLAGDTRDHLADLNDLAGARSDRGNDARRVGFQFGEADQILRGLELRFGGFDLRLRRSAAPAPPDRD